MDLFYDDITNTVIGSDAQVVADKLEADAKNITDWLISNELCLAKDKTCWVIFGGKSKQKDSKITICFFHFLQFWKVFLLQNMNAALILSGCIMDVNIVNRNYTLFCL